MFNITFSTALIKNSGLWENYTPVTRPTVPLIIINDNYYVPLSQVCQFPFIKILNKLFYKQFLESFSEIIQLSLLEWRLFK